MPIYLDSHNGVSISEAQMEAAFVATTKRALVATFELFHPVGTPDGPIYVVNQFRAVTATIDAGASRNAGQSVAFIPMSVVVEKPEESDASADPSISLTASGVSGIFATAVRLARGSLDPWELIERDYASDDFGGPAILPTLQLYATSAAITSKVLSLSCGFGDSANVSVPRLTYRRDQYPGLAR